MSNELILERKKPHFISTEFKAQRIISHENRHGVNLQTTSKILKALAFIAVASTAFLFLSKKRNEYRKNKEALAYEVW